MFKNKYLLVILFNLFANIIFSQSLQDIERLKKQFDRKNSEINSQDNLEDIQEFKRDNFDAEVVRFNPNDSKAKIKDSLKLNYFGYDFFTKRDTVKFWENLPVPSGYIIGPGDEITISIWGQTQIRKKYIVSREGKIYDEKVGIVIVSGKTIDGLNKFLKKKYGQVYSTLKDPNPSSYIDISLGELRSINVNFVGELKYPGVYALHPFSNLITGLFKSGGVNYTGSLRNIYIKRDGKRIGGLDLYRYLISGSLPKNIQLMDQDIVVVPVRKNSIEVDSSIVRPGIYEALEGESIKDLIKYSGGLNKEASNTISIKRITPLQERMPESLANENYYISYDDASRIKVQNGDRVEVKSIFKSLQQVEILGQVKKQGIYNFYDGMTIGELIDLSGGFNDSTFLKSVYLKQAEIIRRDPSSRYEKIIKIDLKNYLSNENYKPIKLFNLDRVIIHANLNFFERKNIKIIGEVNIPGEYPLISDGEDLLSIIDRAGGFTTKALKNGIFIYREQELLNDNINIEKVKSKNMNRQRVAWENTAIKLMPNDSIIVRESTGTISISGEVYNPGIISFKKGKSINYYINSAGGLTNNGDKNKIIVIHANGLVSPNRRLRSPQIYDGAHIIVNKKEPQEPFDITQFATNWTSIVSSMVTAIVLSQQISN